MPTCFSLWRIRRPRCWKHTFHLFNVSIYWFIYSCYNEIHKAYWKLVFNLDYYIESIRRGCESRRTGNCRLFWMPNNCTRKCAFSIIHSACSWSTDISLAMSLMQKCDIVTGWLIFSCQWNQGSRTWVVKKRQQCGTSILLFSSVAYLLQEVELHFCIVFFLFFNQLFLSFPTFDNEKKKKA